MVEAALVMRWLGGWLLGWGAVRIRNSIFPSFVQAFVVSNYIWDSSYLTSDDTIPILVLVCVFLLSAHPGGSHKPPIIFVRPIGEIISTILDAFVVN